MLDEVQDDAFERRQLSAGGEFGFGGEGRREKEGKRKEREREDKAVDRAAAEPHSFIEMSIRKRGQSGIVGLSEVSVPKADE